MTDDRKLDILSRLAAGKLSAEEADAQLRALDRSSSAPDIDGIRDILYDLLDLEDSEDDEERKIFKKSWIIFSLPISWTHCGSFLKLTTLIRTHSAVKLSLCSAIPTKPFPRFAPC